MLRSIVAATMVAAVASHNVKVLDSDSFAEGITGPITLVKFYAPWCGHCKKIAPEYETASDILVEEDIALAEVDCTADESKDICSKYGVRGYPTLKVFRPESEPIDYEGGRDSDGIVKYMRKQTQPAFQVLADKAALDKMADGDNTIVFFGAEDDAATFIKVANALRNDFNFGIISDADFMKAEGATAGNVVMYRKFDEPKVTMEGELSQESLEAFISAESMPLYGEIGPDNYSKYMARALPIAWSFVNYPASEEENAMMTSVAREFKGQISFVKLDGERWAQHGKSMGINGSPGLVINHERKNFVYTGEWNAEGMIAHAKGMLDGSIEAHLKSQPVEAQPEDEEVFTLVGKNFEEIAFDNTKDVMVEFYAPWCGHCKSLAPKYEKLAEEYKAIDTVVIAKLDATENDTPIDVSGFPTLFFFPADDNKAGLKYEGDRTAEGMSSYIKANAKSDLTAKEEGHDEL